jgi:Hint module
MSPGHLVMVENHGRRYHIPASIVKVGDILSGQRVQSIHEVVRRGIYAPLTHSGEIMVNSVTTSNYVDLSKWSRFLDVHTLGHIFFYPQRCFCYYFLDICQNEMYIHGYGPLAFLLIGAGSFIDTISQMMFNFTLWNVY